MEITPNSQPHNPKPSSNTANSFDLLRLVFSLVVVVFHCFPTAGLDEKGIWLDFSNKNFISFGVFSVFAFFLISGYLITASFENSSSITEYFKKRFLRIYPGLWVCFVVSSLVFGYIFHFIKTGQNYWEFLSIYFRSCLHYIEGNLTGFVRFNTINDLVSGAGRRDAYNASLWTIIFEIRAYIFVAIFGAFGFFKRRYLILVITAAMWIVNIFSSYYPSVSDKVAYWIGSSVSTSLYTYFLVGMCFWLFRDKVKYNIWAFGISILVFVLAILFKLYPFVGPISFGYIVLFLAFNFPIKSFLKRYGDPSYGIYIYSWPIQNILFLSGFVSSYGMMAHIIASVILSTIAGFASWHLVEKHFLKKKLQPKPSLQ
jgi:peptidoglycan/LPS O-acetylase OafA/YrhL